MEFDERSLQTVFANIEEFKHVFSENSYIQICNFLKIVHSKLNTSSTTNNILSIPGAHIETPEKLYLDAAYRLFVLTEGQVKPEDKLKVLNKLNNKYNLHFTLDYESNTLHIIDRHALNILYKFQRKQRCQEMTKYISLKLKYSDLLEEEIKLCFCD